MSTIQFDERDEFKVSNPYTHSKSSFLTHLLTAYGLSKKQTKYILLGILIVSICITFFALHARYSKTHVYLEDLPLETRNSLPQDVLKNLPSRNERD